jgi:hypothetical protein
VLKAREDMWWFKSRSPWLEYDVKFFHGQAIARMIKNNVKEITIEDGTKISDFLAIKDVVKTYFENFCFPEEGANPKVTTTMLENILTVITLEENVEPKKSIEESNS